MGIETIVIVLGAAIIIAIVVAALRAKRGAGPTRAPKSDGPSTVRRKP